MPMATARRTILVVGDIMIDRTIVVDDLPLRSTTQAHANIVPLRMIAPRTRPDVLGGAGTVARAIAVCPRRRGPRESATDGLRRSAAPSDDGAAAYPRPEHEGTGRQDGRIYSYITSEACARRFREASTITGDLQALDAQEIKDQGSTPRARH